MATQRGPLSAFSMTRSIIASLQVEAFSAVLLLEELGDGLLGAAQRTRPDSSGLRAQVCRGLSTRVLLN